jgi:hypothetical protein
LRRAVAGGAQALSPKRKWQAITIGTLLLVPAYWALLAGLVGTAVDDAEGAPDPTAAFALGLALIPFVFIVLAFMTEHPRAAGAVVKAMGMSLLVGIPVSALAGDAVSGIVAGVGAGAVIAIRPEPGHGWRARAAAIAFATVYTFVLVRTASVLALLPAPVFPLTAIGLADHYVDWKQEREAQAVRTN